MEVTVRSFVVAITLLALSLPLSANEACCRYAAKIISCFDGDTCTADLWRRTVLELDGMTAMWSTSGSAQKLRLARIDAPELRAPTYNAGRAARDYLLALLAGCQAVAVVTSEKDVYKRWIAEIECDGENVSDRMVESGHAVYYDY